MASAYAQEVEYFDGRYLDKLNEHVRHFIYDPGRLFAGQLFRCSRTAAVMMMPRTAFW